MVTVKQPPVAAPAPERRRPARRRGRLASAWIRQPALLFAVPLALVVLWPLLQLQARAVSAGGAGFRDMFAVPGLGRIALNTIGLAIGSVIIAVVLGATLAWCVSRSPRRVRPWLAVIPLLPLVVPAVANTTGWIFLLSPRVGYLNVALRELPMFDHLTSGPIDIFSMTWIVVLTGFSLTGFVYLYVRSSMDAIGTELEAAASVSGASPTRVFFTVTLPLVRPALVYSAGIVLLLGVGQFTNPLLLGRTENIDVITTVLFRATSAFPVNYGLGAALAAPLVLVGILVMIVQRRAVGEQARYVVVTGKSSHIEARGSWLATLPVLLFAVVAVLLPVCALILVALSPFWSGTVDWSGLTTANITTVLSDPRTVDALTTSITAIGVALLVVVPVGFVAAMVLTGSIRTDRFLRGGVDLLATIPLGMPAAIFGFAVLYTYAGPPAYLYGTTIIIVIAYVTLMIPHAMRPQLTAMVSVGKEYAEASRVSGGGPLRTLRSVQLPLVRGGVAVAAALVVIMLFHEFAASMMVRSARTQVIGTLLYEYYTGGIYPQVAVVALLMVVVTAVGVLIALAVGGTKALQN